MIIFAFSKDHSDLEHETRILGVRVDVGRAITI